MTYEIREYIYGGGYRLLGTYRGTRAEARVKRNFWREQLEGAVIWEEWVGP